MQRATHPSPIAIVSDHVEAWRRENRWSRETVADLIVQAHGRIGGPIFTGITFEPPTVDTFERMRVNADRVFRWLDDRSKDKNLLPFNFILSVLAAIPEDRRVLLVNDLLQPVCLAVTTVIDGDIEPTPEEIAEHFRTIVTHTADATVATSQLLDGVHGDEAEHAEAKLNLAGAAIKRMRGLISRIIKRRKSSCA
ncbi:hypothetical protein [Dechloromonas denitrificans]|uniref:hypothetical protein n=1 Tax=Dechloromonas denitrificans TaxID=281362 RepID=UPI001CF81C34|nr:hypothetical protein [Dechloromonas denitrificans]UCV02325.1 hypothetical protein KI611_14665 [Dechloromonas denitrificans]